MKNITDLYSNNSTNVRFNDFSHQFKRLSLGTMGLLFPQKTRSTIKRMFFKPMRKPLSKSEQQWIDTGRNFQIKVGDKTIQCWQWGEGPQILAVHGWNGSAANLNPFFNPLLEQGNSIVAFDAPAHGKSEGEQTNYFEITDTVRAMVNSIGKDSLAGIIAHSIGAAAVINCLSKESIHTKTALIAPALKLKELLFNTFEKNGVPNHLYTSIIAELEQEYGYSIERDNPYNLLEHLDSEVMIAHDRGDRMVSFTDASTIAGRNSNITFHATKGLGHKHILKDKHTVDAVLQYLTHFVAESSRGASVCLNRVHTAGA